jgi:hypothetical protein
MAVVMPADTCVAKPPGEDGQTGGDAAGRRLAAATGAGVTTDTSDMKRTLVGAGRILIVAAVGLATFAAASAAPCGKCRHCTRTAAGAETPYGDTGCGPRYCGAKHDECWVPDPCDGCARWRGCNGAREMPEKLAPWQLPPGRGFQSGQDVGYAAGRCGACQACGPRFPWVF